HLREDGMKNGRITRTVPSSSVWSEIGHGDLSQGQRQVARPKNRPDIDGLRAVAVIPVLLFHARVPYVTGGFVGVDVFFVISGYLITSILHRVMALQQFPLLLYLLLSKTGRWAIPLLSGIFAASLLLSIATTYDYPAENFYSPVTRAWELGLGSLLAIALQRNMLAERSSEMLSALGLALIVASIFLLDEQSTFPGLAAVPVCVGTALVIY